MKVIKRILIIAGVLLVLLVAAAFSIPFLFKGKLLAFAKQEINATLNAKVDFQDVSLSLFRSFPNLNFQMQNFSVTGVDAFEGVRLVGGQSAEFTLDLMSVLSGSGPVEIKSVHLEKPEVNVFVLKDGVANYDIVKPSDAPETPAESVDYSGLQINLREYSIAGGNILYDDKSGDIFLEIKNLNHSGEGNFTIDVFDLRTKTAIEALTVAQGGITLLNKAKTHLEATFNIDQKNSKYTLKDNVLRVNELQLNAAGFVQMPPESDDIAMNLKFSSPQNDFKSLFSLIPSAYIEGYENVKVNGKFDLAGDVKGVYNGEKEQYPAFRVQMAVENGDVKYPDLPLGIANIQAQVDINSPNSNFDNMVVNVSRFAMKVGSNPFEGKFLLKTPISDPDVDAVAKGVINLGELAQAFPMQGIDQIRGIISADISAKTRLSFIENQEYDRVNMNGQLALKDLIYRTADMPAVNIRDAQMDFTPRNVQLNRFDAKLGKSDIQASGAIDNILAYFSPKKTMTGTLKVRSNYFDANEWLTEETPAPAGATPQQPVTPVAGETTAAGERPFDRFDFTMDAKMNEIVYADYRVLNAVLKGNAKPNRLQVETIGAQIGKSDITASGVITDAFDYLFDNGTLGGDIQLRSKLLDLNQFMTTDPAAAAATTGSTTAPATTENLEPIEVPANIAMNIQADIDRLIYTNMVLEDLKGRLVIENQSVVLEDATTRTLGGTMAVAGGYDSKNLENPVFNFKFDLKKMDFQKSFATFNTFQKLAPIGKYIEGLFNTSLIMEGRLGKDMMPDLSSLTMQGFLQTLDGVIKGFKPLQAIGNSLNIKELKDNLKLTNSKNWFEVKNGAVELKEFDYAVQGIAMKIGGTHSLTQDMDYKIKAKVPRKLLEQNAVGAAASSGLNALQKEAAKYGVNLKQSEFVNVLVNLTGSITDPKVKLQLLGADGEATLGETAEGQVKAELDKQKEELRQKAEAELEKGKAMVNEKINQAADTARAVINKKVDEAKDKATEVVKEKIGEKAGTVLDSTARKKVDDVLEGAGKESKDKIKEELDKFNPFKKKKKDGEKDGGG